MISLLLCAKTLNKALEKVSCNLSCWLMHAAGIFQLKEEVCLLKFSSSVSPFWSDFIFLHPEKQQQDMIHNTFSTVLCIS